MAVPAVDVVPAIESLLERKEMLHKAFSELESKKAVLSKLGANWKDVDDYLKEVEERLRYTLEEFSAKEEALDAKMKEAKKALDKRDTEVSAREQASLAFVQEQKDAAVAVILELKCKWSEVRKRKQLEASKKKEEEEDEDEDEDEEEDTSEKEENPDTQEGAANSEESPNPKLNITNGSALQAMGANTKPAAGNGGKTDPDHTLSLSDLIAKEASVSASKSVEIKPRSQLKSLCEAMASDKLRLFIAERRKDLNAISAELPFALKAAGDPAQLVLKALEGYYPSDHNVSHGTKKDVSLPANKRACVIMLEALADVLADPVLGAEHPIVSEELKSSAKQIADLWKSKINLEVDLTSNLSIDAQSFLQLLATFGLASEYDQDELCKLVLPIARRKQTPSLCRSLDLSSKLPDVIESLIKDGKQMEAISFAAEFELLDRFQPVPLLKSYLKDVRKVVQNTLKGGNNTMSAQNDANQKELSALKVVLKAINDFKLEKIYAPAPLEKRVAQLEKAKVDRKRSAPSGKPQQMKRPRTHNSGGATGGMVHEKSYYRPSDSRAQYGDAGLPYNAATQSGYDRLPLGGYSSAYGGGTRSPVSLQSSYMYPSDSIGSLGYGSSAYPATPSTAYTATPSAAYSSYGYGTGLPSRYQSYL